MNHESAGAQLRKSAAVVQPAPACLLSLPPAPALPLPSSPQASC